MTRRGYALATRLAKPDQLLEELHKGYGPEGASADTCARQGLVFILLAAAISADWQDAPEGVDVIQDPELIRRCFPTFDPEIATVLHIRRAGDISGQQLGSLMLETIRAMGGKVHLAACSKEGIRTARRRFCADEARRSRKRISRFMRKWS